MLEVVNALLSLFSISISISILSVNVIFCCHYDRCTWLVQKSPKGKLHFPRQPSVGAIPATAAANRGNRNRKKSLSSERFPLGATGSGMQMHRSVTPADINSNTPSGSIRENSAFLRVVSALDVDERYQIQMQLQKLYRRLDVINSRIYGGNNSNVWSCGEDDEIDEGAFDEASSSGYASSEVYLSKRHATRGGNMMSVLEEEGGVDDQVTISRHPSYRSSHHEDDSNNGDVEI